MAEFLTSPVELIWKICYFISPPDEENTRSHDWPDCSDGLAGLNALSQTCRRFQVIVNPILYARGVHCHHALPLAWAAAKGNQGTLNKALAAGADVNHQFVVPMSPQLWEIIVDAREAATHLANTDPHHWPSISKTRLKTLNDNDRLRAEAATADLSTLEVFPVDINGSVGVRYLDPFDPNNNNLADHRWYIRKYMALHLTVSAGHVHIINSLLGHGAGIDTPANLLCRCVHLRSFITNTSNPHG
ncbi:uncharacterized protein C8A04DRAFT_27113 [Dichotomopilus funicola]|uniref:Uncharacterized protein n=1 Tax=Dichotomopilus funicola TaxID=1934379 RepID=A0AAN6V574_9PEZI|nr:hypothetical protein C8A04DRAFT_27113 [Dichotomopilus funicola]